MSARLGEMLLTAGALTEVELEQVLSAQAIYGGRLGTNLVEMGLLEEDELARLLNEKLGVPSIDAAALDSVPQEVLAVIPPEMLRRYRVLPVALEGKRLTIAMVDPSDFQAVDDIAFVTGLVVVPRVCSELRLTMALERNCGIRRDLRYLPVQGGLRSRFARDAPGDADAARADEAGTQPGELGAGRRLSVKALGERLAGAGGEASVITALLSYLGGEFDQVAFLSLQRGMALGVQAVRNGETVPGFPGYALALDQALQLKRLVREGTLFLGAFEAEGAEDQLMKAMGGGAPAPALLVPLSVGGRVAAVICVNDLKGRLAAGAFELQRVAVMVELALEMLLLRKRIRSG